MKFLRRSTRVKSTSRRAGSAGLIVGHLGRAGRLSAIPELAAVAPGLRGQGQGLAGRWQALERRLDLFRAQGRLDRDPERRESARTARSRSSPAARERVRRPAITRSASSHLASGRVQKSKKAALSVQVHRRGQFRHRHHGASRKPNQLEPIRLK